MEFGHDAGRCGGGPSFDGAVDKTAGFSEWLFDEIARLETGT